MGPAGPVAVEALRGFEYVPASATVDVKPGATATVTLGMRRLVDLPAQGWYSGDTHAHDLHQGRFGLTHRTLFEQSLAEDLHVSNVLIHMDGTRLMGRWGDLTGKPSGLSTATHILQYAQEYRGSLGHIGMIGLRAFILPFVGGAVTTITGISLLPGAQYSGYISQAGESIDPDPFSFAGEAGLEVVSGRLTASLIYYMERFSFPKVNNNAEARTDQFSTLRLRLGLQAGR